MRITNAAGWRNGHGMVMERLLEFCSFGLSFFIDAIYKQVLQVVKKIFLIIILTLNFNLILFLLIILLFY